MATFMAVLSTYRLREGTPTDRTRLPRTLEPWAFCHQYYRLRLRLPRRLLADWPGPGSRPPARWGYALTAAMARQTGSRLVCVSPATLTRPLPTT